MPRNHINVTNFLSIVKVVLKTQRAVQKLRADLSMGRALAWSFFGGLERYLLRYTGNKP